MKRTVILGAGFGGIKVAHELQRRLGGEHDIVLVDRRRHFLMGLRKLWALVDHGSVAEGSRSRTLLNDRGIRFLQRNVTAIDPAERRIVTEQESLDADYMVVALGAEPRADLVPGLAEQAHNAWSLDAVPALGQALGAFDGGRIAIVIAGGPYKCPPAPYECAMLLDDHLRERGVRDRTELLVTTFQPMLLPNAGKDGSVWLGEQLDERGITWQVGQRVQRVEPGKVVYQDGDLEANILIGVPPHRPPAVVQESGLTGDGEWVPVDRGTFATPHPGVYAIGDLTQIELANGLPLPKAGLFAERQGERVALDIVADVRGGPPPAPFDGQGYCFIETGKSEATLVQGEFYAEPEPKVVLAGVSTDNAAAKRRFEAERLEEWFGQ